MTSPPAAPRPAASVVLLRRGRRHADAGLEVLLLKRSEEAVFMPGLWVFPGGALDPGEAESIAGFRTCARRELAEEASIELAADEELVLFSRWITPEAVPIRYDARFFLAPAPPHCVPRADGTETTEARWIPPREALESHEAGTVPLSFPTIHQLRALDGFGDTEEALAAYRDREVEPIMPKVVGEGAGSRILLPGDPDYPR